MRKLKKILSFFLASCLLGGVIAGCSGEQEGGGVAIDEKTGMILNADGSYGGSLDEEKYGKGAPKTVNMM